MKLLIELDYGSTLVLDHTPEMAKAVAMVFGAGTFRKSWRLGDKVYAPSSNEPRMKLLRDVTVVTNEQFDQLEAEAKERDEAQQARLKAEREALAEAA